MAGEEWLGAEEATGLSEREEPNAESNSNKGHEADKEGSEVAEAATEIAFSKSTGGPPQHSLRLLRRHLTGEETYGKVRDADHHSWQLGQILP